MLVVCLRVGNRGLLDTRKGAMRLLVLCTLLFIRVNLV